MKISIAGLGQMGAPIARNLQAGGDTVLAVSRGAAAFAELDAAGLATSTDFARLAEAEIIFLCLPSAAVVTALLLPPDGLLARLRPGQVVIDLGTTDYARTLDIAARLAAAGVGFLDAPISGMAARARDATLTVMCGGEPALFAQVAPLLARIGSKVLHVGPSGSGQLMKLINQLLFDINAAALAEVLPMASKLGLDPALVGEVVNSGTGRSYASEFFVPRILDGQFSDGYPMHHAYKDLVSGAGISAELGIPMPVLAAATATYQTALLKGHGARDKGGMVLVFEELLDAPFRRRRDTEGSP